MGQVELGVLRYPRPGKAIFPVTFLQMFVFHISPGPFAIVTGARDGFLMCMRTGNGGTQVSFR